jgi:hypothetical protein
VKGGQVETAEASTAARTVVPDARVEEVSPNPAALIESMRAFGYLLPTAIADLIDNSITARAKNVWVDFHWNGYESWIAVRDDGHGMESVTLTNAMRLQPDRTPGCGRPRPLRTGHEDSRVLPEPIAHRGVAKR